MSAESSIPNDKADLLARIQREWSALMRAIEGLPPEQMSVPDAGGWSIKDNLAHLTAWEQLMLLHYLQGRPPHEAMQIEAATFERLDENGTNAILFERNRNRSVAYVLDGLRRSHEQVLAFLGQMSFSDLMKPRFLDDPQARPVINWVIGNTYEHYQEHLHNIQAIVDK